MNKFDLKIVTTRKNYFKWSCRVRREKQLGNGLIMIEKQMQNKLNKPTHIGVSILELSKILMYYIHYNYIKNYFDDKAELLLTEANNLIYETESENV